MSNNSPDDAPRAKRCRARARVRIIRVHEHPFRAATRVDATRVSCGRVPSYVGIEIFGWCLRIEGTVGGEAGAARLSNVTKGMLSETSGRWMSPRWKSGLKHRPTTRQRKRKLFDTFLACSFTAVYPALHSRRARVGRRRVCDLRLGRRVPSSDGPSDTRASCGDCFVSRLIRVCPRGCLRPRIVSGLRRLERARWSLRRSRRTPGRLRTSCNP